MLEEIRQQPAVLERTLAGELRRVERFRQAVATRRPHLVILAARGTSGNAALFGRYLLEITTGIPVSLAAPSAFTLYDARLDLSGALAIGISQSGESTDTNIVIERARKQGALTACITNEGKSTLAGLAEFPFLVRAGREKSVAATKTYTGQLMMLYMLAYALGAAVRVEHLRRIPEWTTAALSLEPEIRTLAERYRFMQQAVVVGRGLNFSNAFELSLKLMETCYVVAERFSSADLLHGPIAMLERSFPVFLFAPPGVTWPGNREIIGKLRALKADVLLITDEANREARAAARAVTIPAKLVPRGSSPEELYTPVPYIVPAQLFAACLAEVKELDPDRPRMLSKVTKTL